MTETRKTFAARLRGLPGSVILSDDEIARIELAYDLAKTAHRWQRRKDGTRYFEHPRRTALLLIDRLGIFDTVCIICALLHDTYEDCPKYVTPHKVEILGGSEAGRAISFLSKRPKEGYADRLLHFANWRPLVVKLCDRYDNLCSLAGTGRDFQAKQMLETRDVYLPIFDRLVAIAPEMHRDRIARLVLEVRQIVAAGERDLGLGAS